MIMEGDQTVDATTLNIPHLSKVGGLAPVGVSAWYKIAQLSTPSCVLTPIQTTPIC